MGWLSGWQYRKSHEINGSSAGAQTDYQVGIRVHYGSGTDSGGDVYLNGKCRDDFGDIRFADSDGETLLAYWMEEKVDGDYAVFWVKVPSIPADPDKATIYIYYGKSDAVYDGDGAATFVRFDDFEDYNVGDPPSSEKGWEIVDGDPQIVDGGKNGKGLELENNTTRDIVKNVWDTKLKGVAIGFWWKVDVEKLRNGYTSSREDDTSITTTMNESGVVKWYNGSSYQNFSPTLEYTAGTWIKYEHRITEDGFKVVKDGEVHVGGLRNEMVDGVNKFTFDTYSAGSHTHTQIIDDFYVRKYVDPEPSHGSWGTEEAAGPTVSTQPASNISTTSAVLNGSVDAINDSEIVERGFEWGTEPGNYPNSWTETGSFGAGSFSHQITGLSPGTTYHFRAKARNNLGKWGYGDEVSFTTLSIQDVIEVPSGHGCIYYPKAGSLNLDLSWAKWMRLHLYGDHTEDFAVKIRLYTTENDYYEANIVVKAGEWRKYEISMDSLSEVGSPSLSNINLIAIHSPYPLLIDSDHVFLPAIRELVRARFTLRRDSPDDPSPKIKLVKLVWREGA